MAIITSYIVGDGYFCWHGSQELAKLARASNTFTWLIVEARKCMQAHCRQLIEITHFASEDWLATIRRRMDGDPAIWSVGGWDEWLEEFHAWDQWMSLV